MSAAPSSAAIYRLIVWLRPQDVLATMYRHLGVDTKVNYPDFTGRPNPVLPYGDPIEELF